jgi:tetratricopeptide (TPR) repeat protein
VTVTPLQTIQYRLAQHYLNKLRTAATVVQRGQTSVAYGLNLFDQDWYQIKHWQAWSAQRSAEGEEWTHLCKDFPLAGRDVLTLRNHGADYATWLETALEAAQQLQDRESECAILTELNVTYYRLGVLDKVERFARRLLQLGEAAHDFLSIGRGLHGLGIFAAERGMYADAEQYQRRALEIFMKLGIDAEVTRVTNSLGIIAYEIGDYQQAYQWLMRHLQLTGASGKKAEFCTALLCIGELMVRLKDYAEAEAYILRAVAMCRTFGFQRLLGVGLINLGGWAKEQNQLEVAASHLEEGIQAVRATGTQRQIMRGLCLMGDTRLRQGNYSEALAYLHEGLQMARDVGLPRYIADIQYTIAKVYLALDDLDTARSALHEALTIAARHNLYFQKVKALCSAVAYFYCLGWVEQAAIWAGFLMDNVEIDEPLLKPVCSQLEMMLGKHAYHQALEEGKALTLDDAIAEVLEMIKHPSEELLLEA